MPVEWSRLALEDIRSLRNFGNARDPNSGTRMAWKVMSTADRLLSQRKEHGRTGRVPGTRELPIPKTPFIAPYRVHAGYIEILRVYHHSQKWPEHF